jgi:hypothetical protein
MADWQKIKTEYITTDTSYRKLAQKYGVSHVQIGNVGKQEDWVGQRKQYLDKTLTKTVDTISKKQVDRAANLISVADLLLDKVKRLVESDSAVLIDTQNLKHISGVLKDIKEVQMIRSDADMREQEARIANLRKQAEADNTNTEPVRVIIEDGLSEYSK